MAKKKFQTQVEETASVRSGSKSRDQSICKKKTLSINSNLGAGTGTTAVGPGSAKNKFASNFILSPPPMHQTIKNQFSQKSSSIKSVNKQDFYKAQFSQISKLSHSKDVSNFRKQISATGSALGSRKSSKAPQKVQLPKKNGQIQLQKKQKGTLSRDKTIEASISSIKGLTMDAGHFKSTDSHSMFFQGATNSTNPSQKIKLKPPKHTAQISLKNPSASIQSTIVSPPKTTKNNNFIKQVQQMYQKG